MLFFLFYRLFFTQDDYVEALIGLHDTVVRAYRVNPKLKFEVFIHKVDGLSDDSKIEIQRDICQRVNDELNDLGQFVSFTFLVHVVTLRYFYFKYSELQPAVILHGESDLISASRS